MINKYVVAVCNVDSGDEGPWIETCSATSLKDAEDKLIMRFTEDYDLSYASDWKSFLEIADQEAGLLFGDIQDIETL